MHRKLLDSTVFQNADLLKVWVWCLLKATHEDYEAMVGLQVVKLKPGQFVTGRIKASAELNMSENKFYRNMKLLAELGMINQNPNNKYTVVTIDKWGLYQGSGSEVKQQIDNKQTASRQQVDTYNNNNNNNNINKYIYGYLEQSWSMPINSSLVDDIDHLIKEYGEEKVKAGIDICTEKNIRTSRYLTAVVRNGSKRKEDQGGKSSGFDEEAAKLRNEGIGF